MVEKEVKANEYYLRFIIIIFHLSLFFSCSASSDKEKDITPPSTVSDLSVSFVDYYGAQIEFTATGDDLRNGTAYRIELRYSENELFAKNPEINFQSLGIEYPEVPLPPPAGKKVKIFLKNLEPKTRYFVAVRIWDEAGNSSRVSNIVEFITKDVPGSSGIFQGRVNLDVPYFNLSSDGKDVYLLFPGIHKLQRVGEFYKLETVSQSVPPISGAQVVWDGEKFVSIGGIVGDELVDSPIAVFPDGRFVILGNRGNLIPFGSGGFFGAGVLNHKISKIDGRFVVLGGRKFYSRSYKKSVNEATFGRVGLDLIPQFITDGNSILWDYIKPSGSTSPASVAGPAVFPIGEKKVVLWGGNTSDLIVFPSTSAYVLKKSQDNEFSWEPFVLYSGRTFGIVDSCEAESVIRILHVREVQTDQEVSEIDLEKGIPPPGTAFLLDGKKFLLEREEFVKRIIIVGNFRLGDISFSGMVGVYIYGDGKVVLVRLKPEMGGGQVFSFPKFFGQCSAVFQDNKFLYLLTVREIYIFKFRDYDLLFEK